MTAPSTLSAFRRLALTVLTLTSFNQHVLVDTTPMPASIPKVQEIGVTSAPLLSASFFIGDRCKPYNDDYMMCKTESNGKGELECMKEGRKVTRCAASVYVDGQWIEWMIGC
jgi:NADH dehydrogenase (ubiquinone) 1 alpha subcomplex subunit 8